MPVVDLSAYKPVPATLGDANQIANGFQAIQTALNGLDNNNFAAGKIFDPLKLMQDGATAGQALVWSTAANGGTGGWVPGGAGLKTTVSALSGGPPASPSDTDIWIATGAGSSGADRWVFQYDAAWVTDAYKWKCIGAEPSLITDTSAFALNNTSTWTTRQSFTATRAGVYRVVGISLTGLVGGAGNGTWFIGLGVNGANNYTAGANFVTASLQGNVSGIPGEETVAVAGQAINMMYLSNTAGTNGEMGMSVVPVRII